MAKTVTAAIPVGIHTALKVVAAQRRVPLIELMTEYLTRGLKGDGQEVKDA